VTITTVGLPVALLWTRRISGNWSLALMQVASLLPSSGPTLQAVLPLVVYCHPQWSARVLRNAAWRRYDEAVAGQRLYRGAGVLGHARAIQSKGEEIELWCLVSASFIHTSPPRAGPET